MTEALEEGDRLRRLLDRGLRPHRRVRHDRDARPDDVRAAALAAEGEPRRAHVLRHPVHPTARRSRATRGTCCAATSSAPADLGFTFYVGPELEFFYFANSESPQTLDNGGYFDLTPLDAATDLRRETVLTLEELGIAVEASHHEVAPSQHEIDLRYTDALTMADNTMTYRLAVKEIALKNGVYATFMPKPLARRERLRHARPPVAVQGRAQRLLRRA